MSTEVSIVIVNFNSGEYLAGCVESLLPPLQAGLPAEIVVIDNCSTQDQSVSLADVEARGARVLRLERNTGYAGGCNRGLATTRGRFVFLLNADVVACSGALPILVRYLAEHPGVALSEPRCYVDAGREWKQPEFWPLTSREVGSAARGRMSASFARRRSMRTLRRQLAGWQAREAGEREALSGAFLAGRREALERVGGFDEGYPLAYEDSDLFDRLRAAGWKLALVPEAEAIHYAHRSRITVLSESFAKDTLGRRRYLGLHHGRGAVWLDRCAGWVEGHARRLHPVRPRERFVDLGSSHTPLELELSGPPGPSVMQLALEPFFALPAGHLGEGRSYRFSDATWRSLLPTSMYVRAFALDGLEPRGAWTFRKL